MCSKFVVSSAVACRRPATDARIWSASGAAAVTCSWSSLGQRAIGQLALERRSAGVAGQRRCEHVVMALEHRQDELPRPPRVHEAVQADQRRATAATVRSGEGRAHGAGDYPHVDVTATSSSRSPVGVVAASTLRPQEIIPFARLAEELGFGEAWFGEDYFWVAGISAAAAALTATSAIPIGIGIVSAMVRHPAVLALEIATIDAMHPSRLRPAIGLGNPGWIEQMGRVPGSQLAAMRETVSSVIDLLGGATLDVAGREYSFTDVRLEYPPADRLPVYMGAVGPKMHTLAGEIADATLSGVLSSPPYIATVRELTAAGRAKRTTDGHDPATHRRATGAPSTHRLSTYAIYSVDRDGARAKQDLRELVAFYLATLRGKSAITDALGYGAELLDMHQRGGEDPAATIRREMPDAWLETLGVGGEPDECAAKIQALLDAGCDSVILNAVPAEQTEAQLRLTAAEVLTRVVPRSP
jgi:5,10-methylenetetrahydromethanopterin reductase